MRKMPVSRSTGRLEEHVADTVMMLTLMLSRRQVDGGEPVMSSTIADKTLGLIGFDRRARAVVKRAAQGFGMRVLVQGAVGSDHAIAMQLGAEICPSLDDLLVEVDFVSLHGHPGGDATIDAHRLNQMKPDACLINTTHGDLVDEQALLHALWFETIGGAGIAVAAETSARSREFRACDNAIVLEGMLEAAHASGTVPVQTMTGDPSRMNDNVISLFTSRLSLPI